MGKLSKLVRDPRRFVGDSALARDLARARRALRHRTPAATDGVDAALRRLDATASAFALPDKDERRRSVLALEELFFALVGRLAPGAFLEIGAKEATASTRAVEVLGGRPVVAFEANPYTHARFAPRLAEARARHGGPEYRNVALAAAPGEVRFFVRRTAEGEPSADGQGSLLQHQGYEPGHLEVTVPATTLDAVVAELGGVRWAAWIDVEGALRDVLEGGPSALRSLAVAFVEVEERETWKGQWLRPRVVEHLLAAGLVPVARDFQSRHQHNLLFVPATALRSGALRAALLRYRWQVEGRAARR